MSHKIFIVSFLFILVLSACNPVFQNLPTAEVPAALPAELPVSTPATAEVVVVNTPTSPPVEIAPTADVQPVAAITAAVTAAVNSGPLDDEAFDIKLAQAIEAKSLDAVKAMMGDRFAFLVWNTDLREVSSAEAFEILRYDHLGANAQPTIIFGTDVVALLNGVDPLVQWGPVMQPVRAIYAKGLGPNAANEAVFVIAEQADGVRYLYGIILPPDGYFHAVNDSDDRVTATNVKYVQAQGNLRMRTGPGSEYAQEDMLYEGQVALVTGMSKDGGWWRVVCETDASGYCWISADPSFTTPVTFDLTDDRVASTDVKYVQAQANVRMRSGPGFEYDQEGMLYEGQIALVTGISLDAAWWRVFCETDASGYCWISADPSLTSPTTAP